MSSNNARFGTGCLLGARMTDYDVGVTADNGIIQYPHAPRTIQHLNDKGIAVYGFTSAGVAASVTVTVKTSGTVSVAAAGSYIVMSSASCPAGSGLWVRTSAEFPA